jgi:branched-chain amino acid transport system permease protein
MRRTGHTMLVTDQSDEAVHIDTYVQFLLLGTGSGAVYAAIAVGLVLTYRSSGVLNFAHGAVAMYATYVFVALRVDGELFLPIPGSVGRLHVGELPTAAAAVVAIVAAALLEVLAYLLVFRPLRRAPALSRVVASVGLMLTLQAVVTLQYGADAVAVPTILPNEPVSLLGTHVPADRLYLAGIVAVIGAALWAAYRFTRFGLASRAAAEDETALALVGWSPTGVAAVNWALAGVLAALGGILAGPIVAPDPTTFSLLVVPALAAALVARLTSFGGTVAVALALGMVQSLLLDVQNDTTWLPASGIGEALPLLLVIGTAVARGQLIPARGTTVTSRLPLVGRPRHIVVLTVAGFAAGAVGLSLVHGTYRLAAIDSLIAALVCLSLVVVTGYLGQLSLAQMVLAGVAGFGLSRLQQDLGVPFPVDVVLATLLATLVGLLIGLPALRVRGAALAVATLAGALAVEALVFKEPRLTGGFAGSQVDPPSIGGLSFAPVAFGEEYPRLPFAILVLGLVCACCAGVAVLRRSTLGRRMLAVRDNERAAESVGISVTLTKLAAFATAAGVAGLAGSLVGWEQGRLSFASFGVFASLALMAVAYIGGIGTISGALVGGALVSSGLAFTALDDVADLGRYQLLASGLAVLVVTVLAPDGVMGGVVRLGRRMRRPVPTGRHRGVTS